MHIKSKNNERKKKVKTFAFLTVFAFISSLLCGQAIYTTTLNYEESCEHDVFADDEVATPDPVQQVVDLKLVGDLVQKDMRMLLPVRYDEPLQVLAGDKENYLGAECVLRQVGPDVTEFKGRILFTIRDKQENNIKRMKLDINSKHLPDDTLITIYSQKANGDNANDPETAQSQENADQHKADVGEKRDDQEKADKEETSGDATDSAEETRWNWLVTAKIRDVVVEEGRRVY